MRCWSKFLLGFILLIVLGGALSWWWQTTSAPDYRLRQGRQALHQGDFQYANDIAARLEAAGSGGHALVLRGEAAMLNGQPARALTFFHQITDTGELRWQAAALAGRCLLELGRLLEAEKTFMLLLHEHPDDLDAQRGLAAVFFDQGAWPAAERHCREWARLSPHDGRPHRLLGLMYRDLGKCPEAIPHYQAALGRDLKDHVKDEIREELAECLIKSGDFSRALEHLDQAAGGLLAEARTLTLRALCLRGLGRTAEALALSQEAVAADPHHSQALRLHGRLLLEDNRVVEALAPLEKALASPQQDFETHHLLAQVYARLGRTKEAQEQQAKVQEIQGAMDEVMKLTQTLLYRPKEAQLHRRLAELYQKLNMPDMAARSRRTAQVLAPLPASK